MHHRFRFCLVILTLFSASSALHAAPPQLDWNPEKTWVFVAGLLEWQYPQVWSSFPAAKKDRRDKQLVDYFKEAGVQEGQIVYLQDSAATKNRIEREFASLLDKTDSDDLLVFYFCGHGYRDPHSGQTWFANYDANRGNTAWNVRSIYSTIEQHFSGSHVLLMADCCHSGALYDEAWRYRHSRIGYAALTSSYSHNLSTGNWTFSDSVLTGFRGSGLCDIDGDRIVTLDEVARYAELELAFIEGQKSIYYASDKFPKKPKVAPVAEATPAGVGQRIEVNYKGTWYKAKTIGVDGEKLKIHYTNYDNSWDEWVGPDRVRPYRPLQYAVGDQIEVQWSSDKKWYPATVQRAWYGLHFIRYDGYDQTWDEWVGPRSIRSRTQ